jgi:hypothetical protein
MNWPKKAIPWCPRCMNFAKIWDFTLPTSVGGFLGPEITSPHGLLFDYPARGDPSPHEDMQICIQFLWLLAPLGLGMLRRSEVPVKMGHSAECPTNSWVDLVDDKGTCRMKGCTNKVADQIYYYMCRGCRTTSSTYYYYVREGLLQGSSGRGQWQQPNLKVLCNKPTVLCSNPVRAVNCYKQFFFENVSDK